MYKLENKTVKGLSPLTINKTAENKMKVFPHGYTYQETRSGKNLLNYDYIDGLSKTTNGITFTVNDDGGITANGTATANAIFYLVKKFNITTGDYKLVGENENYSSVAIRGSYKQDGTTKYISSVEANIHLEGIITNFEIYVVILSGKTVNNITFYPMLLESTETDLTFERGGASPSSDYPSRIRNVGDNINLFINELQNKTLNGITMRKNQDGSMVFNGTATANTLFYFTDDFVLNIIKGDYTASCDWTGNITGTMYMNVNTSSEALTYFKLLEQKNETFSITENKLCRGYFYIYKDTVLENLIVYPKLEKGSTPTPYTPYNCGSADFKVENKNKCKLEIRTKTSATATIQDDRIIMKPTITTGVSYIVLSYREFEIGKKYTVSFKTEGQYRMVGLFSNSWTLDKSWYTKTYSFTLQEGDNTNLALGFYINNSSLDNELTIYDIQIEEGNIVTDYVPHQEQIKSFPFTEGQLLHKGDYLAADGIHQKRKTYVFTGTENITYDANINVFTISAVNDIALENGFNASAKNIIISNYFKGSNWYSLYNKLIDNAISGHNSAKVIKIRTTEFTSVDEFKTFLTTQYTNGTPVTIEYKLAEEIVIPYTPEQEYVLNHIYSYEKTTNIDIISEFETEIDVEYTPQFLQEIKDKFISGPTFGRIHILDTDENFTQDNYLKDFSVSELRFVPDKGLFGGCVAKKVDVNFNNVNKQFSIQDKEFETYLGVDYEDERYEIKYGTFIVQHPETEDTTDNTSFTALDYMIKFNQKYIDYVTYPCTLRDIAESICIQAGVTLAEEKFRNDDFIVENNQFVNGENLRQVLQGIALSAFSWARVDENNELHFDLNQKEDIDIELTPNEYYNLSKDDYIYGPINRIIIRDSQIEGENVTIDDEESMTENGIIELVIEDNPFAYTQEKREQLIKAGKELFGFRYMPVNDVSLIGLAFLNSKDKIRFKTLDGEVFDTYLFDHTINYNGVILDNIQSKALTKTETRYIYKPDITQAIKNTQIIVDKANQTINQIIEKQDEQRSQLVNIETDLSGVHTTIQDNQKDIEEKINEIERTIEGTKQTLTYKGGNNIFYYAKEFWNNGTEDGIANLNEYTDTEIQQKSISGNGYIINKGTSEQKNVVKNDTYTISFTYKKLIDLATGYIDINGTRINLTSTSWKEEVITEIIDTNTIDIKIVSDTANAFKIFDLMGAIGNEKQVWTQNPNETRTDTVTIGKGIQVNSSTKNTYARFDADGNRIYNSSTNEIVTELTDKGVDTDKITADVGQVGGTLIQVIDSQTWFSSLL